MSHRKAFLLTVAGCLFLTSCSSRKTDQDKGPEAAPRKVFLYTVEGPWYIGDPVHEVLALLSLRSAIEQYGSTGNLLAGVSPSNLPEWDSPTAHNTNAKTTDRSLHQFLRGVFWPDDPDGLLFTNAMDASGFSSGIQWQSAFNGNPADAGNTTARSHFGDLQYVHAMSPLASLPNRDVQAKMLEWAGFLIDVAAGRISPSAPLDTVPAVAGRFPNRSTVRDLFVAGAATTDADIRQRAAGALLHLIQDSYCQGHAKRSDSGAIVAFYSYTDPSHDRSEHAIYDTWADGATLTARVRNTAGAADAVARGARVVALVTSGAPTPQVLGVLQSEVFTLASP